MICFIKLQFDFELICAIYLIKISSEFFFLLTVGQSFILHILF